MHRASYSEHDRQVGMARIEPSHSHNPGADDLLFVKELFQCQSINDESCDLKDDVDESLNASMELAYALLKEDILSSHQVAPPSCASKGYAEHPQIEVEDLDTKAVLNKALEGIDGADRELVMALMEQDLREHDRSVASGDRNKVARRAE